MQHILAVLPAMTDACFDLAGVWDWCTPVTPPCRLHFLRVSAGCGRFRFTGPSEGHELMWLIRTGGRWTEARVGHALQALLGRAVYVSPVTARVPGQDTYEDMHLVRLPDGAATVAMRGIATSGRGLTIAGVRLEVFPLTQLRNDPRGYQSESAMARLIVTTSMALRAGPMKVTPTISSICRSLSVAGSLHVLGSLW